MSRRVCPRDVKSFKYSRKYGSLSKRFELTGYFPIFNFAKKFKIYDRKLSLSQKIINNTTYALVDLILTKLGTTVVFIFLVRLLPEKDIASIGISMGYIVLLAYFDVGPIRVLLRDYPELKDDKEDRDQLLTALFLFMGLQVLAIITVYFLLILFVINNLGIQGLSFLVFGMTIDFLGLMIQGWIKTVFYADFQQPFATKISFFFTLARLLCCSILFLSPSLNSYIWILITTSLANCILWIVVFQWRFSFHPAINRKIPDVIKHSLKSYGLWDHLNRMVIDTLFTIDTAILSWFAIGQLSDIGNYTIALKFTSLFFIIPMQLHVSLQVTLSNYKEDKNRFEAINTFLKLNSIISFAQLLFIFVGGKWLIRLLFGANINEDVIYYTIIIGIGVTIMNLSIPLLSVINNLCNLRKAFLRVFLTSIVLGVIIYIFTAACWGTKGIAFGNIVAYFILSVSLIIFTKRNYPFPFKLTLLSSAEKRLIHELIRSKK